MQNKPHSDTTFRGYSSDQAFEYAQRRGSYPRRLMDEVIAMHTQSGGQRGRFLDLGCGPGNSTREIAGHFDSAIGLDPSAEMILTAQRIGGKARTSGIDFLQGDAETCEGIADNSIDLITAATAAHWFDMDAFWPTASRILRPGGTVAIFTIWRIYPHPEKTPRAKEITSILFELEQGTLGPYQKEGNWLLMNMYKDLQMPWQISLLVPAFPQSSYRRQVWNDHGLAEADGSYVCGERTTTLDETEKSIATISAVTRWREAHPDLANTDRDCVKMAFAEIRALLKPFGTDEIIMVGPSVLVTIKKTDSP